jgi:hypothetical protein
MDHTLADIVVAMHDTMQMLRFNGWARINELGKGSVLMSSFMPLKNGEGGATGSSISPGTTTVSFCGRKRRAWIVVVAGMKSSME